MACLKRNIMAVGAHADDIEFNSACTLLKYHAKGYSVTYVLATNNCAGIWYKLNCKGERYAVEVPWYEIMPQRLKEATAAAKELFNTEPISFPYAQRHFWDRNCIKQELRYASASPDCAGTDIPTIITAFEHSEEVEKMCNLILEKNPEVIMTHPYAVYTVEHYATAMLVRTAFLMAKEKGYEGSLVHWQEVETSMYGKGFVRWDTFIDTSAYGLKAKRKAVEYHVCQMPTTEFFDFEDELYAKKECGVDCAERFIVCHLNKDHQGELTQELYNNHRFKEDFK